MKRSLPRPSAAVNANHCPQICREHTIGEEVSEQLEIVQMQIRVISHVRKFYGCRDCEMAPVTADKPAQLVEKSMASPSVLAMLSKRSINPTDFKMGNALS